MPDYIRSEYARTVADEIKSEKENISYQKGMADYFKALAKQAERNGNNEQAQKYSEKEKEYFTENKKSLSDVSSKYLLTNLRYSKLQAPVAKADHHFNSNVSTNPTTQWNPATVF